MNSILIQIIGVLSCVGCLLTAGTITSFPTCSLPACLLAVAAFGFAMTTFYCIYKSTDAESN